MRKSTTRTRARKPNEQFIRQCERLASRASSENSVIDTGNIIQKLTEIAGFTSVYHRLTFRCFRTLESGRTQAVIVAIDDAGPDCGHGLRYSCSAQSDDGKETSANSASTIDAVLAMVHWHELD
jgi:hypothetical protein